MAEYKHPKRVLVGVCMLMWFALGFLVGAWISLVVVMVVYHFYLRDKIMGKPAHSSGERPK